MLGRDASPMTATTKRHAAAAARSRAVSGEQSKHASEQPKHHAKHGKHHKRRRKHHKPAAHRTARSHGTIAVALPLPPASPPPPSSAPIPSVGSPPTTLAQAQRLLWRAGFGPSPGQAEALVGQPLEEVVFSLTRPSGAATLSGPEPVNEEGKPLEPDTAWGDDHCWWLDRMVRSDQWLRRRSCTTRGYSARSPARSTRARGHGFRQTPGSSCSTRQMFPAGTSAVGWIPRR
jgi:hypothetical protein